MSRKVLYLTAIGFIALGAIIGGSFVMLWNDPSITAPLADKEPHVAYQWFGDEGYILINATDLVIGRIYELNISNLRVDGYIIHISNPNISLVFTYEIWNNSTQEFVATSETHTFRQWIAYQQVYIDVSIRMKR